MTLLFDHDKIVADWASKRFGYPLRNWFFATGILDKDGVLIGAATWHDFNGSSVELSYYGPNAMTANLARKLMHFAFDGIKVNRVGARTPRQNRVVVRSLPSFGFRCEGVAKHYYGPSKRFDAILFGLLAADAKHFYEGRI